ncbi:MAG: hypothetical protein WAW06_02100 [bacterium]
MRTARSTLVALAAAATAAAMISGCAKEEKLAVPNLLPETFLAVGDSVRNPTAYSQVLTWWGEDKDGEVAGYEYRWFIDPSEGSCRLDTNWVRTAETSLTFDLPVTRGQSYHRFEVRSIDNDEARDSSACKVTLPVTNAPPVVVLDPDFSLPDTTIGAFLVKWQGSDPNGDNTLTRYRVWLDESADAAQDITPPDTVATFGPDDFAGRFGWRTFNLIAIDSGCDTSEVLTHTWFVKEPTGQILLVDDLRTADQGETAEKITDRFYRTGLDSLSEANGRAYSVLNIERYGGELSAHNLPGLFGAFDLVIWYNDPNKTASARLAAAQGDLMDYLEGGGRLMLSSLAALGSGGALQDSLWPEVLGVDSILVRNGSTNLDCRNWALWGNGAVGLDSLKVVGIWTGLECMLPDPAATELYHINPGTAGGFQTVPYYLAILNSWQAARTALVTFPISRSDYYGNARVEYCKIVELLLQ